MAVHVEFFTDAIESEYQTEQAGRPVYVDIECIRLLVGGSRDEIIRRATPEDRKAYPDQYARYKAQASQAETGTPLKELTFVTAAMRKTLESWNVRTAEMLAELSDTACQQIGGGLMALREQARAYMTKAESTAAATANAAETQRLREQVEALQKQLAALSQKAVAPPIDDDGELEEVQPRARRRA